MNYKVSVVTFLLFFMVVFNFKLPFFYNSMVLALLCASIINFRYLMVGSVKKEIFIIPCVYIVLFFIVLFFGFFSGTSDYSRLSSIYSNLFCYLTLFVIFLPYLSRAKIISFNEICLLVFYVFITQSMIILLAFILPSFHSLIAPFQLQEDTARAISYGGVRGLALAGAQFFPLSAAFAMSQIFVVYLILNNPDKRTVFFLGWMLITIAGMTAGRTTVIGFIFAVLYLLSFSAISKDAVKYFFKIIIITVFLGLLFFKFVNLPDAVFQSFDLYSRFAFEFLYSYLDGNGVSTSSTDILSKMYWDVGVYRFFIGYGHYTMSDGSTFMGTDAGYMRNILFFGFFGLLYLIVINLALLGYFIKRKYKGDHFFKGLVFFVFMVAFSLHYKGDVLLHLVSVQTFIFLIFLFFCSKGRLRRS